MWVTILDYHANFINEILLKQVIVSLQEDFGKDPTPWTHIIFFILSGELERPTSVYSKLIFHAH